MFLIEGGRNDRLAGILTKDWCCTCGFPTKSDGVSVVETAHEKGLLFRNVVTVEAAGLVIRLVEMANDNFSGLSAMTERDEDCCLWVILSVPTLLVMIYVE